MATIKVTNIVTEKLIPFDKNPRDNEKAVKEVAKSIMEHGFNQPILIDQKLRICVGHTRWQAAKLLGLKTVPCIKKRMNEEQFIKYNIADNKTGELATWDDDLLKDLMHSLSDMDVDLGSLPGFQDGEIESLLDGIIEEQDPPGKKDPEKKKPTSKRTSKDATKLVYNCTAAQAMEIDGKLDLIIRENGLDNQVEALLFALKKFKGPKKTVTRKGK